MRHHLKEFFSNSSASGRASIKGREAYNFAIGSGFIKGLKTLQKQTGGAFQIVRETIGDEGFTIELNMPSWQRSAYNPTRLERKDTTSVVIAKSTGVFSDSYRLSTTTDVILDESSPVDSFFERNVHVYSLNGFDEKNSVEKTLRHLNTRARGMGFFKNKPEDTRSKKQSEVPNVLSRGPHGFRL